MDLETCQNETITNTERIVNVMSALNDATVAAAERSGTVDGVQLRLWAQLRRTAVLDAIRYELTERNNHRISRGQPAIGKIGASSRLAMPWLAQCMEHAREHEQKMIAA